MIAERIDRVEALFQQIAEWVREEPRWEMFAGVVDDDPYRPAETPATNGWIIKTLEGELRLEYVGNRKDGTKIVSVWVWPTFVRLRLMQFPDRDDWEVVTDAGVPFHMEWNRTNFLRLVRDMVEAL